MSGATSADLPLGVTKVHGIEIITTVNGSTMRFVTFVTKLNF